MAVLIQDKVVRDVEPPGLVSTVTYDTWRTGNTLYYHINVGLRANARGAWWDQCWIARVWINGSVVGDLFLKGRTGNTVIGYTWYWKNGTFSIPSSASSGNVSIKIDYYQSTATTIAGGSSSYQGTSGNGQTMPIPPLPTISISQNSRTHNSVAINYSIGQTSAEYVRMYRNGTSVGDYRSSPVTVTGLSPNTTYQFYANAYASGGFGPRSNTISIKTFPAPVTVNTVVANNITPFSAYIQTSSSNSATTNLIEFALLNSSGTVIVSPITTTGYNYTFSNLTPETTYRARVRMRTSESNVWSAYKTVTFTTTSDQAQAYMKINNVWRKGRMYIKVNGTWRPMKNMYIKVNNVWRNTTNN